VRVLTVMEFVLRRSLQAGSGHPPRLASGEPPQQTNKPTAERILKAFDKISLTIIKDAAGNEIRRCSHHCQPYSKISCTGWDWSRICIGSLKIQHRSVRLSEMMSY